MIQGGFKRSKIYPFYRNAISPAKHNLLFSTPSVKKLPIDNSLQIPLAYFLPPADILADLLDIYIMPQQKIKKLKWQPHLTSANQCLNEQFLQEKGIWEGKKVREREMRGKKKWKQKNKNKTNKGTKTVSTPTEDSEEDEEN